MSLTLSSYTISSAVLGTLKKSDASFEIWREDDDHVPEAMVSKGFREMMLHPERQEADYLQVSTIVVDYVDFFANTTTLSFSALR